MATGLESAEGASDADLLAQLRTVLSVLLQPGLVDSLERTGQSIAKGVEGGARRDALVEEGPQVDVGGGLTVPVRRGRLTVMKVKEGEHEESVDGPGVGTAAPVGLLEGPQIEGGDKSHEVREHGFVRDVVGGPCGQGPKTGRGLARSGSGG